MTDEKKGVVPTAAEQGTKTTEEQLKEAVAAKEKAEAIAKDQRGRAETAESKLKEVTKAIKEEQKGSESISDGSVEAIAKEYGVDEGFIKKLSSAIRTTTRAEVEKEFLPKLEEQGKLLKTTTDERQQERFEKAFGKAYEKAVTDNPEYAKIANPDVIKSLVLLEHNKEKTIEQLLADTYGKVVPTKPTPERSQPGADRAPEKVDFSRMDAETYAKVKADTKLWADYSDYLVKQGGIF